MATPSEHNPSYTRVLAYMDAYYDSHFDGDGCEEMRHLHLSHAQVSIAWDHGNVASYRNVTVSNTVATDDCNGSFHFVFESGDVIVDFNRAVEMLDDMSMAGYYSDSVQSYAHDSIHSYASVGRGVILDWKGEGGPILRTAAPHEYLNPWNGCIQ